MGVPQTKISTKKLQWVEFIVKNNLDILQKMSMGCKRHKLIPAHVAAVLFECDICDGRFHDFMGRLTRMTRIAGNLRLYNKSLQTKLGAFAHVKPLLDKLVQEVHELEGVKKWPSKKQKLTSVQQISDKLSGKHFKQSVRTN